MDTGYRRQRVLILLALLGNGATRRFAFRGMLATSLCKMVVLLLGALAAAPDRFVAVCGG